MVDDQLVRLHRRQFVLGPEPALARPDWITEIHGADRIFSRCPELRTVKITDRLNNPWLLLGLAVEIDPSKPAPADAVRAADPTQIDDIVHGWSGRWLLIGPDRILSDASALLGCLYCRDRDDKLWISTSARLLIDHGLGGEADLCDSRQLVHERGISWFPPPFTRFAPIQRLLPSQGLDPRSGETKPRALMPVITTEAPVEDTMAWLETALTTAIVRLRNSEEQKLWLGLTAGYDSRLMLALAVQAGVALTAYTRLTPRMSLADRILPPQLALSVGYEHRTFIDRTPPSDRRALVAEHAAGSISAGDALPLLKGTRDTLTGISFGGHGFALASGFWNWRNLPEAMPEPAVVADRFFELAREPAGSPARQGIEAWAGWARQTAQAGLDWRDRLFIEQRQAGWLAAKEQAFDMQRLERWPILNCGAIYAKLLSLPAPSREGSNLQAMMVSRLAQALGRFAYNPGDMTFLGQHPRLVLGKLGYRFRKRLERATPT